MPQGPTTLPGKRVKRVVRLPARKLTPDQLRKHKEEQEKTAKALDLRASGATYREIAQVMGWKSAATAQSRVKKALEQVILEPAKEVIVTDLMRLDEFQKRLTAAMRKGDIGVIPTLMNVMRERRALLGWSPESWAEEQRKGEGVTNNGVMVIQGGGSSEDFIKGLMQAVGVDPDSEEAQKRLALVRSKEEKNQSGEFAITGPKPNELLMRAMTDSALNNDQGPTIIKGELVEKDISEEE